MTKIELTPEQLEAAYDAFREQYDTWLKVHKLKPLRNFKDYENQDIWGQEYRDAMWYMEEVAGIKNAYNGLKHIALDLQGKQSQRVKNTTVDNVLTKLESVLWGVEEYLRVGRARLDFFKTISYVIGNMTWGMQ